MKKIVLKLVVMAALLLTSSINANAQLSDILGGIGNALSGNKTSDAVNALTGVISSKLTPTSTQILGTWVYQEPAVVFTSENALKNIGGSMASSAIEKKLQGYISKAGLVKGNLSFTFNKDKTFIVKYKQKNIQGTYKIEGNNVTMTFKGKKEPCKMIPQLDNGTLIIAMDASKFKTFLTNIGQTSTNTSITTITSLLKSYDGMKLGVRMTK